MTTSTDISSRSALFQLGFRPLFLVAMLFATLAMALWMVDLLIGISPLPATRSPVVWHAHEMIYGYSLAVIAGFLLTAVRNWTGEPTVTGLPLKLLLLIWVVARAAPFVPDPYGMWLMLVADNLFIVALSVALTIPVVRAKRWKSLPVVSTIHLFLVGNMLFDLGVTGYLDDGVPLGISLGLYLVLYLMLLLARRVMPMFIGRGTALPCKPRNFPWVDRSAPLLFLGFVLLDILTEWRQLTALFALLLALVHAVRLVGWCPRPIWGAIWSRALLWVLVLAYGWLIAGFLLTAGSAIGWYSPSLALHALAVGGIGMMTMGMMARVAWGHSGRDLQSPPAQLALLFALLAVSGVVRVVVPALLPASYVVWIGLSQLLWITAFAGLLFCYVPVLWQPRVDGKPG
ncbi:MAG: NnrS family protein [Mariprofundales bacterium]|nr:NnrS family protein [Mariprofundales bacterium]